VQIDQLPRAEVRAIHPALTDELIDSMFDLEAAVERRQGIGGPARARVIEAIADARSRWRAH